jgi:hypothetical protein
MDSRDQATQHLHNTLKAHFSQMRFARAAELARSRRYLEAEGLLSQRGIEPLDARELDLLARISGRQSQYERARHLWEAALKREPDNEDYKQAIERTLEAERFNLVFRKIVLTSIASLLLILVMWRYVESYRRPSGQQHEKEPESYVKPPESSPLNQKTIQ